MNRFPHFELLSIPGKKSCWTNSTFKTSCTSPFLYTLGSFECYKLQDCHGYFAICLLRKENLREESSLSVVDSYCSILISAILSSFTVRQAELSEIQNWKNRIKKSKKNVQVCGQKNVGNNFRLVRMWLWIKRSTFNDVLMLSRVKVFCLTESIRPSSVNVYKVNYRTNPDFYRVI
jgi:hypothetical protein